MAWNACIYKPEIIEKEKNISIRFSGILVT